MGEYSVFTRSVDIDRDLNTVADFIKKTTNLPQWTHFFVEVGEFVDDYYLVETKMGLAQTRIEPEPINGNGSKSFIIRSQFGERLETAKIDVEPKNLTTFVTFHIGLPNILPADKVELMLNDLQSELYTLKGLLEKEFS